MDQISGNSWQNFFVLDFLIAVAGVAIGGATMVNIVTYHRFLNIWDKTLIRLRDHYCYYVWIKIIYSFREKMTDAELPVSRLWMQLIKDHV